MSNENAALPNDSTPGEKQIEKKRERKEHLKGIGGTVKNLFTAINDYPRFKELYGNADLRFLLVATDYYPGVLLHVDHGLVKFTAIPKEECEKWKKTGAQALLQCTLEQFLAIATRKLNPVKAWIKRQIKIRGPRKLIELNKIFILSYKATKVAKSTQKPPAA